MVTKECPPTLGRRPSPPAHVFGNGSLSDIDPQFQQLTMNARRSPQWVGDADVADEGPQLQRRLRRPARARDFQRQNARNPRLCQPITVPGSMIDKAFRIPRARRYSQTKRSRSVLVETSLSGLFRRSTLSWWRRATISASRSSRSRKNPVIAPQISPRMPVIAGKHRPIFVHRRVGFNLR